MLEQIQHLGPGEFDIPKDVVGIPLGEAPDISDDRIREIMARLGVILHDQIAEANTFFGRGNKPSHLDAIPMDDTELAVWRSVYGLNEAVEEDIKKKILYLVNIDDAPLALSDPSEAIEELAKPEPYEAMRRRKEASGLIHVNYGEDTHWVPRELITLVESPEDLTYVMKPQIHFGGHGHVKGHLYNAFVAVNAYAKAANGVQLVSDVYGKGFIGNQAPPVFNPHSVMDTSLWMNTSIKDGEPNSLSVNAERTGFLMLSARINEVDTLPDLEIPQSEKVRTWFWQLNRLMANQTFVLPSSTSLPRLEADS